MLAILDWFSDNVDFVIYVAVVSAFIAGWICGRETNG